MSEENKKILDFSKLEDLFFCIDVLTRARFSIKDGETEIAADIDRIIASLTAISQNPPSFKGPKETMPTIPPAEAPAHVEVSEGTDIDEDEGIIDLLTGEKIV